MNSAPVGDSWMSVVPIPVNEHHLTADIVVPRAASGLVIFAHGSGSSRHSPRNKLVADTLRRHNIATLLVDLLTEGEDADYSLRFDIDLLTERLIAITDWAVHHPITERLKIGYFGASTGAAAALLAASAAADTIKAVVSRGGRVDLADIVADAIEAPTMLIVGEYDIGVREANETYFLNLQCKKELVIVPRATHLFEESGALEQVAEHAAKWFALYLDSG